MDFNPREFDTQREYRYVFPTPPPTNVPHFSDQSMIHVSDRLWDGGSTGPVDMMPEVRIGVGYPAPVSLGYRFEPGMLVHVEPFPPDEIPVQMPMPERYGGGGYHRRDIGEYEAVPFRRLPPSPEMKRIVMLGNPEIATMSGSKRKAPLPPSPPVASFNGVSSKKIREEWRCEICEISAPCERGFNQHLRGKKHLAQMESLDENGLGLTKSSAKKPMPEIKNYSIGLGTAESVVKKQPLKVKSLANGSKAVKTKKMFKFWCKMCKTGVQDERGMVEHRKGKKHIKNRRKKTRAKKENL